MDILGGIFGGNSWNNIPESLRMSQDALGQLKHLKTARARWPFPDDGLHHDRTH